MVNAFASRMTELRRKRGITQKQAAISLGISQALLSHYEKGVRECGLDFLLKAAAFYEVSTDYLLGREKKEPKLLSPAQQEGQRFRAADRVIFDLLEQTGSRPLMSQASDFLSLAYYRLYRLIYCGGHPPAAAFSVSEYTYRALADAAMQISEMKLQCVLEGRETEENAKVDRACLQVDEEGMSRSYGKDHLLLKELLRQAEKQLKER